MAAVAPSADQASDLMKNLSLDSETKTSEIPDSTNLPSVDTGNGLIQPSNRSVTPLIPDSMDPTIAYFPSGYASTPYYYGGYDGTTNDCVDPSYDGYSYGYGYAPYGPYSPAGSPVPTVGQDGQSYGAQQYQYPSSYFQPLAPTGAPYPAPADQSPLTVEPAKGTANTVGNGVGAKRTTGPAPLRPTTNGSYGSGAQIGYHDPRYGFSGVHSPIPWLDGSMYYDPQSKNGANKSYGNGVTSGNRNVHSHLMNPRPMSGMNTTSGYMNRMYPNKLYGQYGNTYRSGYGYGYDLQNNYKPRGRGNGFFNYNNENGDGLNELNRGPRARTTMNQQKPFTPIAIAVKGQSLTLTSIESVKKEVKEVGLTFTPDREMYNQADFPENYENAKFFVIKSYSEDDVHKSIKYSVWASTQNGNKKLDAAYHEAQQMSERCPVFLFFSVNTSGQFVGVAEMTGPVDFNKSLEYWQQDKWIGCFPVKWHIVKDLPNILLKHIIIENNENKPVTNSRDTQEVKLEQGLQMIKIFKEHTSKQCILDDFEFYEDRQKKIQEKKAKQQQFQKQAWEGKLTIDDTNKEGVKADVLPIKSTNDVADLVNEVKLADNVEVAKVVGDVAKSS